ncbi:vesicle-associated membrane protein-associated protein A-like isoform X2 [Melanaphis sacchari]|uniref:Vesicle-associated membrane protein-associated protein A n=1 Tax=Melanaphis sacchari TaxID=742174 RepID=A0A2H8TMJ2_9HEMI|nr:vesicle-associated membrane protein-associated protein A-like isoform X1 [Melanaphis sacchari]XP_025194904.1 vesicle-associated membrane protein-associated protein A-like isoform X2 [Melanaphis sacchari]
MSSKIEQILFIEPPYELKFKGPFTEPVQTIMSLKNPSEKKVAFKIKTTAPKRYCVRPNCGELAPKEKTEISVILQPFDYDANERNKHKFLVQTVIIDPVADYGEDGKTFQWRDIEEGRIMDSKLKCSFEMPTVEQLLESKNIHEDTTAVPETDPVAKEIEKVTTGVIKKLREEETILRQENMKLKEELLQLKNEFKHQQSQKRSVGGSQHLDMQNRNANITLMVGLAIVVALLGIIAGKYVF